MRQHLAKLTPTLFLVGGCSLIYNPNNIEKPPVDASDAQMIDTMMMADARIDAPPIRDADPSMLVLEDVAPNVIYEGQGQGGSRPALLVIKGMHIIPNAAMMVTISPSTGLTIGQAQVSANGNYIAVPVSVAVNGAVNSGMTPLTITVMQQGGPGGGAMLMGKLDLVNLPQFPTNMTTIAAGTLAPLYSEVNTTNNITFTGDSMQPAIIRAVSSIRIGNIVAAGADGGTGASAGGGGGPGGCDGGGGGSTGGCSQADGGGGGGGGSAGGGGGGFASVAGGGNGAGGGAAGVSHGNPQIVSYAGGAAGTANQSAGGGGGAATSLAGAGAGGGGGGTVELTAGGTIQVGTINVNGGRGGDGSGLIVTNAGGGGGGSGGVVVLRSDGGMITAGSITANPGGAGSPAGSGGGGGMGAAGRVRIDVAGTVPSTVSPAAHRGPSYAANTMTIVTTDNPTLMLSGTTDDIVDAYVIDADDVPHFGEPMNQKFVNGQLSMQTTMLPGYNKFCVTLRPGTRGQPLADKCIEIAYLP